MRCTTSCGTDPFAKIRLLGLFPFAIALPYLANSTGWMLTEMGRQPWVVFGLMKTEDAFSPTLTPGMVLTTLIVFTLVYGVLMVADVYLLAKYAKAGPMQNGRRLVLISPNELCRRISTGSRRINMDLNTLWFILIAVLYIGYFVLEGFDLGWGSCCLFWAKTTTGAA